MKNNYNNKYNLTDLIHYIDEFPVADRADILFNLGGVLNHNLYWKSMGSKERQKPSGKLKDAIEKKFGSYQNFWKAFKNSALKLKGSGYTFLVIKNNDELDIINMFNQDTPLSLGQIPLFVVDMWEHAYYLNYENEKIEYLDEFEKVADFSGANEIYNTLVKQL